MIDEKESSRGSVPLSTWDRGRLRIALFISGASVMVVEILGTRVIGPHFGVGLFVWTSLISVTLVALAFGYWIGGRLADRRPSVDHFAQLLLAAAAAVAIISLVRGPVLMAAWHFGLRAGSLLAAMVLFFPSLCLLGMVSPFAVRLESSGVGDAGRSAGRLYAISTAGSVLGALLTGFFLVPFIRVPTVLALVAVALALTATVVRIPRSGKWFGTSAAVVIVIMSICFAWPRPRPRGLDAVRSSAGTDLRVVVTSGNRHLIVDGIVQTSLNQQGRSLDMFAYVLASRLMMARPEAKRVALVGLGGGGIVPLLTEHGLTVECVDLSPEVIELAREHFGFGLPASQVHAIDGRVFLKQRPSQFDAIILDVFTGDRLAHSLVSREGLETAKSALSKNGLLALNTWGQNLETGKPNLTGAAILRTLQLVFNHVFAVPAKGNLLFFASDTAIVPQQASVDLLTFDGVKNIPWTDVPPVEWPNAPVLTDDLNPVDTLNITELEAGREKRHFSMPAAVQAALSWE